MKHGYAVFGAVALSLFAFSCKDFSVDSGKGALTCAASSVSTVKGAELGILDPALGGNQIGQSFIPQATVKNVSSVYLALQAVTNGVSALGNSTVSVQIFADRNGAPDLSNSISTSSTISAGKISASGQVIQFAFGKPIEQLTAKTTYWVVADANYSYSPANHIVWLANDSDSYSDGQALVFNGRIWSSPDGSAWINYLTGLPVNKRDLAFQIGCL